MGGNPNLHPSPPPQPPSTPNGGAWTQGSNGSWTWTPGATPDPKLVQQYGVNALTDIARNPSGQLNTGSWYQAPLTWKWVPGATPDPKLAGSYGNGALTNPQKTPDGTINRDPKADSGPGAWVPQSLSGTWQWAWGMTPDPNLVPKGYSNAELTNPKQAPDGTMGPGNTNSPDYPPEPDVVPPALNDIWGGRAPDVTGALPPQPGGSGLGQQVSQPPAHPAYLVSPGSIRDAENALLGPLDSHITGYNDLKAYVAQTPSQNLYSAGMTEAELKSVQDNLLQNIGDVIELAGQFTGMLNYAAQNYAHADIASFMPES